MIVGISGHSRAGKDEIAKILVHKYGFKRWSFADGLRYVLDGIVEELRPDIWGYIVEGGWDGAKGPYPEVVGAMIQLGSRMREIDPDIWVKALPSAARRGQNYVCPDVRHQNEANLIIDIAANHGGGLWKVIREGTSPRAMDTLLDHHPNGYWDRIIQNDGTLGYLEILVDRIIGKEME